MNPRTWRIVAAAALFSAAFELRAACGPTPVKYRDLEFGDVRFAVEEDCRHTFTQEEQFFLAGAAQHLRSACTLPRDGEDRARVEQFIEAAKLSLGLPKRGSAPQDEVPQADRARAFGTGKSIAEEIRCRTPEAALFARGIVIYLKRTSGISRFVSGCSERYSSRYGWNECRCIADAIRPGFPGIDQRFFDRALIKESIHRSPGVALTLMLSCGVSEY